MPDKNTQKATTNEDNDMTSGWKKKVRKRLIDSFWLMILLSFFVLYGLVNVQIVQHERYKKIGDGQHKGTVELPALRGAITDRKYVVLANSLGLMSAAADPLLVKDKKSTALKLSQIFGLPESVMESKISIPARFVWLDRKISEDKARKIKELNLPGIFLLKESTGKRFYPKGELGAHILGVTGIDDQGLDGIEAVMDDYLKGRPGKMNAEMDREGIVIPGGISSIVSAVQGNNIVLTIDESVQYIVENSLRKAVKAYGAEKGSVIVMDAKTGEILAMATMPDYKSRDPKSKDYMQLTRNDCICDVYEPGSTFKVVMAAAALDSGKVSLNEQIVCGDVVWVDGWDLHNANDGFGGRPTETITDIIAYSYNTGSVSAGLKMGAKVFHSYIKKFGFGDVTGIELPGEAEGEVAPVESWANINLATISYGQGISVTPIQIVSAVQGTINNGELMQPRIIKQILDADGNVIKDYLPEVKSKPISSETSYQMNRILRNVIEHGTGTKARIPGYLAGGKSGTANICENGVYVKGMYAASFVGYAPAEEPKFVMLVKISKPKGTIWGGSVAGPIFSEIGREILWTLGIPPSFPSEINKLGADPSKNQ